MNQSPRFRGASNAFTLVELLVCVAIIALLIAILLPAIGKARDRAKAAVCQTNMRSCATAMLSFAMENNNTIASAYGPGYTDTSSVIWWPQIWYGAELPNTSHPQLSQFDVTKGTLGNYIRSAKQVLCPTLPVEMQPFVSTDTNPKSPVPASSYAMDENANFLKLGTVQSLADCSLFDESATITTTATPNVYKMTSPVEYVSTSQCYKLLPNFMGAHGKKGAVAWMDGHATLESPYYPDPSNLTVAANLGEATYAVKNAKLGFLTPVPQSESYANFIKDARMNQWCVQDNGTWLNATTP